MEIRIDKWLWAVRVFKTRSLAIAACRHGKVSIAGQLVKPAREIKVNDIVVVKQEGLTRTLKVLQLLEQRVGAAVAKEYVEDQTPPEEFEKARERRLTPLFRRPKGAGRPTKKDRRVISDILEQF